VAGRTRVDPNVSGQGHGLGTQHGVDERPQSVVVAVDLDRLGLWIDDPRPAHSSLTVAGQLEHSVFRGRARRQDLAHPIGRDLDPNHVCLAGRIVRCPPTGEIGHQNTVAQMKLRLGEDPPATGLSETVIEPTA